MFDDKFFEENLHKVLGVNYIPENKKKEVMEAMQKRVQEGMAQKIMGRLGMKDKMKMMTLMIKRNPEEIMKFMNDKVPELPQIIQEEVAAFRPEALRIINS